ncbi:competence type IV pilus major pilin ComGC [Salinicoccus jeotgali]|uniref:ComG operon protein 3 n=1 Tax=Salinicoccus jeotgali TaxID=381634 RepID=A0ABP7EUH8_9STAP
MKKYFKGKMKANGEEGFTLIEMLLVLLVISVLIILIIPNIAAQSANVQDTGCEAQVRMVQSQVESYTLNEGAPPASINALVPEYLTDDQVTCANGDTIAVTNGKAARTP